MASIYPRGKKKTWWIEYKDNGRKIQRSLHTIDKTVARYQKNRIENELALSLSPLPNISKDPQVILDEYIEYCQYKNKAKTIANDKSRILAYVDWAHLTRILKINEESVSGYINQKISKDHITPRTANAILISIKAYLNFAIRRNYISANPLKGMKQYDQEKKKARRFLSKQEIDKLVENAHGEIIWPMIAIALYTGMRYSEIKNLCWEDINFKQNWIIVKKSKSKKFRNIPLHHRLKKVLAPLKKSQGLCFDCQNIRRIWKRIRRKAGLMDIGWHTLRHTFASHLIMSGVDIVSVAELLGHGSIQTTMVYAHLSHDHVSKVVEKIKY